MGLPTKQSGQIYNWVPNTQSEYANRWEIEESEKSIQTEIKPSNFLLDCLHFVWTINCQSFCRSSSSLLFFKIDVFNISQYP